MQFRFLFPAAPPGDLVLALAATLAAAPAQGGTDPAPRAVLVELFGAPDCAACVDARAALAAAEDVLGTERVVSVEYLADGPLATPATDARFALAGDPSPPTALFDGASPVIGAPADVDARYRARLDSLLVVRSPLAIASYHELDADAETADVTIDLEVTEGESIADPGAWVVRAFLVEDRVPACCGSGGVDRWDRVVRHVFGDEPLGIGAGGETRRIVVSTTLDPAWAFERLGAVAFVQRDADGAILNAHRTIDALILQPVPASPLDESRAVLLPIVPNPLRGESRISFTLPGDGPARVAIVDVSGRVVRVLTDGPRPFGLHPLTWDGTDARGGRLANGVYVVHLATSRGTDSRKILILR